MQIFNFSQEVGHHIAHFHSDFVMSRIVITEKPTHIGCMYLGVDGLIGFHQAPSSQLLLIMSGQGWVRTDSVENVPVAPGDAVFWAKGEWHETRTETGLTAIVIESDDLNPSHIMLNRE